MACLPSCCLRVLTSQRNSAHRAGEPDKYVHRSPPSYRRVTQHIPVAEGRRSGSSRVRVEFGPTSSFRRRDGHVGSGRHRGAGCDRGDRRDRLRPRVAASARGVDAAGGGRHDRGRRAAGRGHRRRPASAIAASAARSINSTGSAATRARSRSRRSPRSQPAPRCRPLPTCPSRRRKLLGGPNSTRTRELPLRRPSATGICWVSRR